MNTTQMSAVLMPELFMFKYIYLPLIFYAFSFKNNANSLLYI